MQDRNLKMILKLNNLLGFIPMELPEIVNVVIEEIKGLFPSACVKFYLRQEDDFALLSHDCRHQLEDICCHLSGTEKCPALKDAFPVIVQDGRIDSCCKQRNSVESLSGYICLPIKEKNQVTALLSITSAAKETGFKHQDIETLLAAANLMGLALDRNKLIRRLTGEKQELEQANKEITRLNEALKKRYSELQQYEQLLLKSERLAAAGRIAAEVTHEINNPVSIILSRLDCIKHDLDYRQNLDITSLNTDLEVINKHAQRIASVSRSLLTFSRDADGVRTSVDVNKLVSEVLDLLKQDLVKKKIYLHKQLAENIPPIKVNEQQMEQVLVNLLHNARDALPNGGLITVQTALVGREFIEISVKDNGSGIAKEAQKKVFDPFFTTKEKGQGTGLGLPISRGIIEEHGGAITLQSVPGQGTVFSITLPVNRKNEKAGGTFHELQGENNGNR